MDYSAFEVEDFLADEVFTEWVVRPTPEADAFWSEWLQANPDRREVIEKARQLLLTINFSEKWSKTERTEIWDGIETNLEKGRVSGKRRNLLLNWSYAAASVALILGVWFYWQGDQQKIKTGYGERQRITLSDGTKVTLNSNSQLVLSRTFLDDSVRQVWITGEAFFEVASREIGNRKVPFVVNTDQLKVEVLGTAFNVLNRRGRVDVALEHGSVKLVDAHNESNAIMLQPGEKGMHTAGDAPIRKVGADVEEYKGWTENVIRYKSKSLKELGELLQDTYGIEIVLENEALADEVFTGTFPVDSVSVFFDKLQKLYPVQVTRQGRRYYLK